MYKQSPSRNQRSKRLKLKYVLQICLLLAVCFWLIYQVKHSHDKKREFEELDSKSSLQTKSNNGEIIKLGRKDIVSSREDEGIIEEDEENKPEDDEPERINSHEQDNLDDREQENPDDTEVDKEEDSVDEEIESREVETEGDGVVGENESESDDKSTHEAREEQYKADDASSAVTHDAHGSTENSNEHVENVLEEKSMGNGNKTEETNEEEKNRDDLDAGGGETGAFDQKSTITTNEANVDVLNESENHAPPNDTVVEGFSRDSTGNDPALEGSNSYSISNDSSNRMESISAGPSESKDAEPQSNDGILTNSTGSGETKDGESQSEDFSNSDNNNDNTEALLSGQNATLEASVGSENRTENSNSVEPEKEDTSDGTYENPENSESTGNDNPNEEIQQDGIDLSESDDMSGSVEEKEVRTDLETLPEIQTEGTNNDDDVAAE
ncbi:Unknown protein [Striga hermonthica]|uniref:Uncharacterized protein n=1 Tax=Striga hermonthica TaxID=68872 RepID=A0A9N7R240_STRHE|nr:Unknown protein [Striga hermonthica]